MSLPQDDSFNAIVARKRVALEAAASKKKIEISNIALPDTTNTTASGENYAPQGDISFFEKDRANNIIFGDIYGKGTDADSAYVDSDTGVNTGIRSASGMDTWEHSLYRNEQTARPAQIAHYSRLFGVPEEQVTNEMIFAMGRRADEQFRKIATEGQGTLDPESGTMSNRPGKQFEGFEDQMFFPEGQVTYDPMSKRYRDEKRVRVDSLINPATGKGVYAAMNTPEFNTKWFKDSPKQNAVRKAYEAKHGVAYDNFIAPNAKELVAPQKTDPNYVQGRGDDYWDVFTKSVSSGVDNLQATGYGLAALIADRTGNTEFADSMLIEYQTNLKEAQENGANLPKVEDVDWTGDPDAVYRQIVGAVGEFVPSIALGLGAGKLASMGTSLLVKKQLQKRLKKEADKAAAEAASTAAKVAGVTAFSGVGIGGIYGEVASEGFRDSEAAGMAIVGGLLVGALDSVLPGMVGKKLGITEQAQKKVVDTLLKNGIYKAAKNVGKDIVTGKVVEGTTETLQEIIEKTTAELIKTGEFPDHTTPEALSEYLNVLVKASLGGGALKGGTTAVTEAIDAIDGNRKVVKKQTEAVLEEARDTVNTEAEAYDSSTEAEVDTAVTAIENVAKEEAKKLEQPGKTLKQKILPTEDEKLANEEVLNETLRVTSDLGVALPESLEGSSSVDKALYYLDSLGNAGNTELTNSSGKSTTNTSTLKGALVKALQKFKSGDSALNARIETAITKSNINEDYNEIIAKNPDKVEEFEAKRQEALTNVDALQTEAKKQVDRDVAKATAVIDGRINKALTKVERINVKLEDTTIKPKQRKRLEQERDNQMLHASQLAEVNKDNTSTEVQDKVDAAADSFDYSHKKVSTVSDVEIVTTIADTKTAEEELKTVTKNEESTELEVSEAKLKYLQSRQKMLVIRNKSIADLEQSTDKAFIKRQRVLIKGIDDSIKITDAQFDVVQEEQVVGKPLPVKSEDTLSSISIESLGDTTVLSSIDVESLNETDKQTYDDRVVVNNNLQEINTLIKGNKTLEGVHAEVLTGKDSHFKGLNLYLKDAKEGKFNNERFNAFVETLRSKANAFANAKALSDETQQRVFINKTTHEVTSELPADASVTERVDDRTGEVVFTAYKDYWWVDNTSTKLVNLTKAEAELASNIGTLINQIGDTVDTRATVVEQQDRLQEVNAEINKILTKEPVATQTADLESIKAEELPIPVDVDTSAAEGTTLNKADAIPVKYVDEIISAVDNTRRVAAQTDRANNQILIDKAEVERTFKEKAWTVAKMDKVIPFADDAFNTVEEWESFIIEHERAHFTEENLAKPQGFLRENHANKVAFQKVLEARKETAPETETVKQESAPEVVEAVQAEPVKAETDNELSKKKTAPKAKPTETESKLIKSIAAIKDKLYKLAIAGKKFSSEKKDEGKDTYTPAYARLVKQLVKQAKMLRDQKGVKAAVRKTKKANMFLNKFKEASLPLFDSLLTVSDIFKAGDLERKSFFSSNADIGLTSASITTKLKALGVTDEAYIKAVANTFKEFKDTLLNNVMLPITETDKAKGVYVRSSSHKLLATVDGLPDEVIFSMMLSTMHWMAINQNASRAKPLFAIANMLYGDPKQTVNLTSEQINTFVDSGISIAQADKEIGLEILDLLNIVADKETELELGIQLDLERLSPEFRKAKILVKDPIIGKKAAGALGLLGLLTASHMATSGKSKVIEGGLLDIKHGKYPANLFPESNEVREVKGYKQLNTIIVNDNDATTKLLGTFKDGTDSLKLIKGAETALKDTYDAPVEDIQTKADKSFWDLPAKVRTLINKLQQVKWVGKTQELNVFSVLNESVMHRLIGVKDVNTAHIDERDAIEAGNAEKLQDVKYVEEYIAAGSKSFYFRFKAMAQHRIRIVSNTINGQRSKIHRALFFPASRTSTIDNEQSRAVFKLAVGQALGVSIDKKTLETSIEAFDTIYSNATMIELLPLLAEPKANSKQINELITTLVDDGVVDPSMHLLEGITALAQYKETGKFTTTIGIETDGITNGYAIGLLQFLGGNPEQLKERLAKVGIFVDPNDPEGVTSYEEFIKAGHLDIYQTLSDKIDKGMQVSDKVKSALNVLHGEFRDADSKITKFARDLAKNPLMITNYGSGVKKVIEGIIESIVPGMYSKLADMQTAYDKATTETEKTAIRKQVTEFEQALVNLNGTRVSLAARLDYTKLDKEGNPTNLYGFTFKNTRSIDKAFTKIYANTITEVLDELIGPIKEAREVIIQGIEAHYFAFINAFEKETAGITNLSTRMAIAGKLADKYLPRMSGPWSKNEAELIQLINFKQVENSELQIETKNVRSNVEQKKGKGEWSTLEVQNNTHIQAGITTPDFDNPGVSSAINMVQNMDSVVLGDLLLLNPEVLPIYDAVISSVTDAISNMKAYNKAFVDRASHSFLEDVHTQVTKLFNGMPDSELAEVQQLIQSQGFKGKIIIKKLTDTARPPLPGTRLKLNKELSELTVANFIEDLAKKISEVAAQREALLKAFPMDKWTVSQMYLPESLNTLSTKVEKAEPVQQELFKSIDIDAQVKVELEEVYKTDSKNPLRNNLQNIFTKLGDLHDTAYYNEADRDTQQSHLQRVLDGIISKAGEVLDKTTVTLSKTNVKNHGYAHIHSEAVDVNFNRYSPRSYSEQSAQEVYTHELLHVLTRHALLHNSQFKENITRIRAGVKATFKQEALESGAEPYEIFLHRNKKGEVIFLTDEATEIAAAKAQYDHIFGSKVPPTAKLDEFLAYALTNKFIVNRLQGMSATKVAMWSKDTDVPIYQKIIEMFFEVVNRISNSLQGKVRPANLEMEIFELTKDIVAVNQSKRNTVSKALRIKAVSNASDSANKIIRDFVDTTVKSGIKIGSDRYIKLVDKLTKDGKVDNFLANVLYDTKLVAYLTSSYKDYVDNHPKVQQQLDRAFSNFKPNTLRNLSALKADLFGGVGQDFVKLLYKSHKEVDANRRQYKELTKESLQRVFKGYDKLTDAHKESITRVLLKTDLSILVSTGAYTVDEAMELVADDNKLQVEINKYAKNLNISGNNHYNRQTRELARVMITGKANNHNQYLNAHVIYHTNTNSPTYKVEQGNEITDLDIYISMLALKQTTTESRAQLSEVAAQEFALDSEHNGIHGVINLHTSFKNKSLKEGFNNNPVLMTKGHISVITDPDIDIQVEASDIKTKTAMRRKGYTYIGAFNDITDVKDSSYGIYVIKNNPELTRTKGIVSATAKKAKGTTLKEILARDKENAGLINARFKAFAKKQTQKANTLDKSNYTMIPILNEAMEIVDYRINMQHSAVEQYLGQNLVFDDVLPGMFSHLEDKVKSEAINAEAIELLYDYGQANYKKSPKAFIDILSPKYHDEYFLALPKQARWLIEQRATLSKDKRSLQFHVERKLLDTVFGYVNPSISNIKILKGHPTGQRYAKVLEKLVKEAVSMAVVNIVIKIPIVPAVNFASNFVTSMLYGVPPNYLVKHWREGMKELTSYKTDAKRLKLLDLEVLSNPALKTDKSKMDLRAGLVHRMNNNPVAGLVDAGLFTSITEDINQNEFTYRNKGFNKIKDVGNKLFKGKVFDVANHAYLGEHTAVFKASMQFTQMSDFIARYTLYKYNTEQKGMNKDKAWKQMVETFVNYDQPMNRHLQYLNDIGAIMFVKYWLRIQRAGINLIKEKPLNVGMFWAGGALLDIDVETILDSNILTGNFFPTLGGFEKIAEEVIIPPGLEILTGKGF